MRAAIYLRQSLDRNDDQLAVSRQREACQQLCAERGWQTVEYVDNDTSASSRKPRPQYEQMLADVRAGKLDAIVCWHPDRLYRQPRDLEDIIDLANAHNVTLNTCSGDLDLSTNMGRMVARMVGAVNRGEVERKSARQKAAGKQRAKTGAASWSVRPFGYADLKGEKLDEHEAELIRAAYRLVIQGGSLYAIAEEWNKAGIPTPKGNRWRGSQVRSVLISPRNAGRRTYNGEDVAEASWPAIVDYDMWQAAHTVLADPSRRLTKTQGRVHLLSGIALCGVCGAFVRAGKAFHTKQAVYWCTARFCVSRKLADVDRWVEERSCKPYFGRVTRSASMRASPPPRQGTITRVSESPYRCSHLVMLSIRPAVGVSQASPRIRISSASQLAKL